MDLRRLHAKGNYPEVVFVFRDSVERGERFFAKEWPQVRAIADARGEWWKAFAIRRGGFWSMFGPQVFAAALRAMRKGHFVSAPGSSPLFEPGAFVLAEDGERLWSHPFRHIGDHPDFAALAKYKK